jgi:hypothetical protein
MHTTQRERQALVHKILTTRPADCPIRQVLVDLLDELARIRKAPQSTPRIARPPPAITVNIMAHQVAVFDGRIRNN